MPAPLSFKEYIKYIDDINSSKTKKRLNKKSPKGRVYGGFGVDLSGKDDMKMNGSTTNGGTSTNGGGTATNGGTTSSSGTTSGGTTGGTSGGAVAAECFNVPFMWKNIAKPEDEEDEVSANDENNNEDLDDENLDDLGDEEMDDFDTEEGEPEENQDPNKQGIIRKVKNAHLVFKRQNEEGTYEELWVYKSGDKLDKEMEIRRDILAGTDIPQNSSKSKDGSQTYDLWSVGNIQFLHISGLPN